MILPIILIGLGVTTLVCYCIGFYKFAVLAFEESDIGGYAACTGGFLLLFIAFAALMCFLADRAEDDAWKKGLY